MIFACSFFLYCAYALFASSVCIVFACMYVLCLYVCMYVFDPPMRKSGCADHCEVKIIKYRIAGLFPEVQIFPNGEF